MNITGTSAGYRPPGPNPASDSSKNDTKIRALEQRLQNLTLEKQKAVQNRDEEAEKRIEKQMQEIQRQIDRLRQQESGAQEEVQEPDNPGQPDRLPQDPILGQNVDEII